MDVSKILLLSVLLLSSVAAFVMYLRSKTKFGKIFTSILMGLLLAVAAYNFVPENSYDLVRHWEVVDQFKNVETVDGFMRNMGADLEVFPRLLSFVVAKIGDYNLLQASVVLLGYSVLFYMLIDYKNREDILMHKFLLVLPLIIFGQHMLFYFSGLYNYLAINLFAFGVYLEFVKQRRGIALVLYLITPFVHMSMLLPLAMLILFKIMKKRLTVKSLAIFVLVLMSITAIIDFATEVFDWKYLEYAKKAYYSYTLHNDRMIKFYDGFYMFMSVVKFAVSLLPCWLLRREEKNREIRDFVVLMSVAVIILSFSSIAMTRFSSLILFMAIPLIFDLLNRNTSLSRYLLFAVFISSISS